MELLSFDNYQKLKPWLEIGGWKEYNSNIVTMLMWKDTYPMYFQIFDHFALVCFENTYGKHWFMPFCKKEYLKEALDTLLLCSKKYNIPSMIHSTTQEAKEILETYYPQQVYFEHHERGEDYVYDFNQQASLSGKKMQKRRNHYNAFLKEYKDRFEFHNIQKEDIPNIYELLSFWQKSKENTDTDLESIAKEDVGIHYLLEHYEELNLIGGCIYIDGKLKAFNIASKINKDMLQIHIEKADASIRGLYVAIVKHLLSSITEPILYVNREDDMGLPSLKKAKHDMHPVYKVKKYLAIFDKVEIRNPNKNEIEEMKILWKTRFEDENTQTTDFFFNHIMKIEDAWIYRNSSSIMGMAFVNRWKMSFQQKEKEIAFIEGVCTHKEYEACGVMKKIMNHILQTYKPMPIALQAYNWDLYRSFGFKETHYLKESRIDTPLEGSISWSTPSPSTMAKIYQEYTQYKDGYRIHDKNYYQNFFLPYMKACSYIVRQYENKGYVCYYEKEDTLHIQTLHFTDENALLRMLATLQKEYHKPLIVTLDVNTILSNKSTKKIALMMLEKKEKENYYCNELI